MAIANVALTDTFDVWRTRTNQLISLYDETNQLARSSYNATNLAAVTAANLAANVISGNSGVYITIYDNANTITYNVLTTIIPTFYDASNASFNVANAALATSNLTFDRANAANATSNTALLIANLSFDTANSFVANASNSVAEVLASNTIIQNIVNTTANVLVSEFLANTNLGFISAVSNLAYNQANTAYDVANAAFLTANTGDSTGINAYDTANAAYNRANTAGGGYFKGNNGNTGNANNKADLFRINSNTMTGNITFTAGENASATGPLYMASNTKFEIQTGARVVII